MAEHGVSAGLTRASRVLIGRTRLMPSLTVAALTARTEWPQQRQQNQRQPAAAPAGYGGNACASWLTRRWYRTATNQRNVAGLHQAAAFTEMRGNEHAAVHRLDAGSRFSPVQPVVKRRPPRSKNLEQRHIEGDEQEVLRLLFAVLDTARGQRSCPTDRNTHSNRIILKAISQ